MTSATFGRRVRAFFTNSGVRSSAEEEEEEEEEEGSVVWRARTPMDRPRDARDVPVGPHGPTIRAPREARVPITARPAARREGRRRRRRRRGYLRRRPHRGRRARRYLRRRRSSPRAARDVLLCRGCRGSGMLRS